MVFLVRRYVAANTRKIRTDRSTIASVSWLTLGSDSHRLDNYDSASMPLLCSIDLRLVRNALKVPSFIIRSSVLPAPSHLVALKPE